MAVLSVLPMLELRAVVSRGTLVDGDQYSPSFLRTGFEVHYQFTPDHCSINAVITDADVSDDLSFILPIISGNGETVLRLSDEKMIVRKSGGDVIIEANQKIDLLPTNHTGRIFNFVPGMEAIPMVVNISVNKQKQLTLDIRIGHYTEVDSKVHLE
jgi:hypothetical protein